MQIRVEKNDGQIEPYLHTKVLGTFHSALAAVGDAPLYAAEQMAEAITCYLYRHKPKSLIASDEIHLMIESVLTATGFAHAAEALNHYRLTRRLKRRRIAVMAEAEADDDRRAATAWSKARLAASLTRTHNIDALTARAIAGAVEEKVFGMNVARVRKSLLRQLILSDIESFLDARRQLEAAAV